MKRLLTTAMVLVMLATIFCASPVVTAAGSPTMDLLVINESDNSIAVSATFTDVENATWVVWSIKNAADEFIFIDEKRGDKVAENGFDFVLAASEVETLIEPPKNPELTVEAQVSYADSSKCECKEKFTLINYNSAKTVIKDILTEEKSIAEGAKILTMVLPSYYQVALEADETIDGVIVEYLLERGREEVIVNGESLKYSDFIAADETTFNATVVDTNDFYSDLLEAILYASINSKNATAIANIVANYYTTLDDNPKILEDVEKKWYDESSNKSDIAAKMASFAYNDKKDFYKQFKTVVFLDKLSGTSIEEIIEFLEKSNKIYYVYYTENGSDLLLGGSTRLTLDFDKYHELATTDKRVSYAKNYMVDKYTSLAEGDESLKAKFNKLLELLPDVKEESKNTGSSGSGGGGGTTISVGLVTPIVGQQALPFSDIDDVEWAKEAIVALAKEGVIEGVSAKQYQPNANVTREQFVKIIVNTFGLKGTGVKAEFKDADQNEWYAYYINTAVELGIIKGASDEYFGVGENITRQDMTLIMYRVANYKGINISAKSGRTFSDADSVDDYAIDAVTALYQAGIVNGVADGVFGGWQTATRAQAAKLCYDLRESK